MARTAPFPNIAPITGMCPGVAVLGGRGGNGGGPGGGNGDNHGGVGSGGDDAGGDQKDAPDHEKYPECGSVSHPIDVVTGRVFTHPIRELVLPGPLPLVFERTYSSAAKDRDVGLGFGWAHSLGWEVEVRHRQPTVWTDRGVAVPFPALSVGEQRIGPWGWFLRRESEGFVLDADDGVYRRFRLIGKRFRLSIIADRNNNQITLSYDHGERLVEARNDAGQPAWILSTPEGHIASIEVRDAPAPGQSIVFATYAYDKEGLLTSTTDAEGHTARYAYDDYQRLIKDTDRASLTFHFRYDDQNRGIESWGDYGDKRDPSLIGDLPKRLADGETRAKGIHHVKITFGQGGFSEVADSTQARRFFGNKHGLLDKRVEGGGVITADYDEHGRLLRRTDAMDATTIYVRDAWGREIARTDPLGRTTRTERDPHGLPVRIVDPAGGVYTIRRDAAGNALDWTEPTGTITSATYDKRGLMTSLLGPTGAQTRMTYDDAGNCIEQVEPNGALWRWTYDSLGRCTSETDPLGATTRWQWSPRGDLLAVTDAAGGVTRYVYDGERRVIEAVDPLGHVMLQAWGGYHKLVEITDANGETARLGYNPEGELVEIHNAAGEVHRLTYNPSGLLIEEHTFDGRRLGYRYDNAGRLTQVENGAREKTEYTYNAADELIARRLPEESLERYDYSLRGELSRLSWPAGEILLERDAAGRVVREAQTIDGETHSVEVTLDRNGDRTGRRTSLGFVEAIERDAMGARVGTALDARRGITHTRDLLGREISAHLPGRGTIESAYAPAGQIARRWVTAPGPLRPPEPEDPGSGQVQPARVSVDKSYVYALSGELINVWNRRHGWTQYACDPAGRLLCAFVEKRGREVFRYDSAGNLFEEEPGSAAREYGPGGRILRRGATSYHWDEDGRLVGKRTQSAKGKEEGWRYAWNAAGLLKSVRCPDGKVIAFEYDPLARRLIQRVLAAPSYGERPVQIERTRFVWDGEVLVHAIRTRVQEESEPLVVEERTYCFDDNSFVPRAHADAIVERDGGRAQRWVFYVNDPNGTPEELVSERGELLDALDRQAWGKTETAPGGKVGTPLRFQGQFEDAEIGLFYNRFRYYDPEVGGYVSPDPIGLAGGLRLFGYVPEPNRWVDPWGLEWNYRLLNAGKVYYVGRARDADSMENVADRHRNTKGSDGVRFDEKQDRLDMITEKGTPRAAARGVEEMDMQEHGTKIGRRVCNGNNVRGNNISGISPTNPNRPAYLASGNAHVGGQGAQRVSALNALRSYP